MIDIMPFFMLYFYNKCEFLRFISKGGITMDIQIGDILTMKKNHPCGCNTFEVIRSGMDFKLKCCKCEHVVMTPRLKAEKNIKKVTREGKEE